MEKCDQQRLESLEEKKAAHTSCKHCVKRICKLYSKGRPAGKRTWCELPRDLLDYCWRDKYKDPAPKTLDELRQWLRFAWKNDTLWELVNSIPHHLENVRKNWGRHSGYWLLTLQLFNVKWIMNNILSFTKGIFDNQWTFSEEKTGMNFWNTL